MTNKKILKFFIVYNVLVVILNLVHPVTPTLIKSLNMENFMFGVLYSAMSFTLFLFSPFWGKISDSIGRVNVICISLVGYAFGQFLFMNADTEITLIFSRLISGMMASGQSVCAIAYLVDISDEDNRGRNITLLTAIAALCTSIGFLFGGVLGDYSIKLPFIIQVTSLVFLSIIFKLFIVDYKVTNSVKNIKLGKIIREANPLNSFFNAKEIMTNKLFVFLILTFLCFFSSTAYDNVFNYYVKDILNFPPSYNGAIKFSIGIVGLIVNCTLNIYLSRKFKLSNIVPFILFTCSSILLLVFLSTNNLHFILFNMVFYIFSVMYVPHLQTLVISSEFGTSTGVLAGVYNSSKGLGMIFGGIIAGFVYNYNSKLPFLMCSILLLIATVLSVHNALSNKNKGDNNE